MDQINALCEEFGFSWTAEPNNTIVIRTKGFQARYPSALYNSEGIEISDLHTFLANNQDRCKDLTEEQVGWLWSDLQEASLELAVLKGYCQQLWAWNPIEGFI